MLKKLMVSAAALLAVTATLAPAADAQSKKPPIRIAFIADLTGAFANLGRATQSGSETALKMINDAGGVGGRMLELEVYDTQGNSTAGAVAIREALSRNPAAATGYIPSAVLAPSIPVITGQKVPWLFASALFTGVDNLPYFFSPTTPTSNSTALLIHGLNSLLGGSLKGKKIGIEAIRPSVIQDEKVLAFKAALKKAGGTLQMTVRDPINVTIWSSQAANVAAANLDALVVLNVDAGAVTIVKALSVAGVTIPVLADTSANSDATMTVLKAPNFFAVRDTAPPTQASPIFKKILEAKASSNKALGSPQQFARGYNSLFAIQRTLAKCGVPCPSAKFGSTLRGLGKLNVPLNPFFGSLDFSKSQSGVDFGQLWTYDKSSGKPAPVGPVLIAG